MTQASKNDKKRTIIEIPIKDYKTIQKYAKKYNLSFSSAIILLALKSLEYEKVIDYVPGILNYLNKGGEFMEQDDFFSRV